MTARPLPPQARSAARAATRPRDADQWWTALLLCGSLLACTWSVVHPAKRPPLTAASVRVIPTRAQRAEALLQQLDSAHLRRAERQALLVEAAELLPCLPEGDLQALHAAHPAALVEVEAEAQRLYQAPACPAP